jgi:hypothetical protein
MAFSGARVTPFQLKSLTYLFSHEGDRVVAHCLDLDIVTSGGDRDEAEHSLDALVQFQITTCFIAGNFPQLETKAPIEYWQSLTSAKRLENKDLEIEVPPVVLPVTRKIALPVARSERVLAVAA